jgi:MYXO-CTERM domain-containing protein
MKIAELVRPRRVVAWLLATCTLLVAALTLAAGRTQWTDTTVKERDDKSWKVEVAIYLPKPPEVPYVPMKFEFQQTMYYAKDRLDGDTPEGKVQERKVPIENKQALIEGVDVGFLDPGTGATQARTKFSFKLTRAHGYEAGEYRVTIRDTRNGSVVGTPSKLIFLGDNEIVDRRTMVFSDAGGKKKQMKEVDRDGNIVKDGADGGAPKSDGDKPTSSEDGAPASGEGDTAPPSEGDAPSASESNPGEIKQKPGGCGCSVPGAPAGQGALAAVLGLALVGVARRRRAA